MKHVDAHGLATLSMWALEAELGIDPTARHRHSPTRTASSRQWSIACSVKRSKLTILRARYRVFEVPDFDEVARSDESVHQITAEAFRGGLDATLDTCAATLAWYSR